MTSYRKCRVKCDIRTHSYRRATPHNDECLKIIVTVKGIIILRTIQTKTIISL